MFNGLLLRQSRQKFFIFADRQILIIASIEVVGATVAALPELQLAAASGVEISHHVEVFGSSRQIGIVGSRVGLECIFFVQ